MKKIWISFICFFTITTVLTGCEPLLVLDPKGPQGQVQAKDIMLSIWIMSVILIVVYVILAYMLFKFRASKQSADYKPPYIKGSTMVEIICVGIPVLIVIFLSIVSVQSNNKVESTPAEYKDKEPLIIYAATSNWKWHFSYPAENIETVNYLYIPVDRPIEFKLYSYGPITSFWIPQLGGQKYAMSDMVNTLHLGANTPGEYMGRNASFSGKGFAENTFRVEAVHQEEFHSWVKDIKNTSPEITEEKFDTLLKPGHVGEASFNGTHLTFYPAPDSEHGEH
ncbi:cytochrome aa3 quinol oxidase subunit II [Lysinibacillus xylanilyticus]|uniref:cytochrome aa3 quinol oxidase subunit II n=1 Tax=Lysinibacillus xylanilyticus TaxID=582475 RepID=UPI0038207302